MGPVMIGFPDHEGPSTTIRGIDIDNAEVDLFGKPVVETFEVSDIEKIYGSYAFSPEEYQGEYLARNRERLRKMIDGDAQDGGITDQELF